MQPIGEPMQITLDGGLVPVATSPARGPASLSRAQLQIMEHARAHGGVVRSVEAGVILHRCRTDAVKGECRNAYMQREHGVVKGAAATTGYAWGPNRIACCPWASTDGSMACRRLAARGYLVRGPHGWLVPDADSCPGCHGTGKHPADVYAPPRGPHAPRPCPVACGASDAPRTLPHAPPDA